MYKLIPSFIIVLIFLSCEDRVKFEEPQPANAKDLNRIPQKLQGTYLSDEDDSHLTITGSEIVKWSEFTTKTIIDSLDIEVDSTMIDEKSPDLIQIIDSKINLSLKRLSADSISVFYSYRDTIFQVSEDELLRRYKGHYFLNYKWSVDDWSVRRLTLKKNKLTFSKIRKPEDLDQLKDITQIEEVKSDSGKVVGYKLKPSRKELKQLIKHRFSETGSYTKVAETSLAK